MLDLFSKSLPYKLVVKVENRSERDQIGKQKDASSLPKIPGQHKHSQK